MKPLLFKAYTNGICIEEKWFKLSVLEYGSNQCLIPNATNWPFTLIFYVFKYKCYPMKMLDIAFQMWDVRQIFQHSFRHWFNFFRGNLQDQKCKKWSFSWFTMYSSTNITWWKCQILHTECKMWDEFLA